MSTLFIQFNAFNYLKLFVVKVLTIFVELIIELKFIEYVYKSAHEFWKPSCKLFRNSSIRYYLLYSEETKGFQQSYKFKYINNY